jgi:outer membrane protein TolC
MKAMSFKKILIFIIGAGLSVSGKSQHYPDSLLRYIEIATTNNPAVLQKYYEYQAALQKVPQVGSLSDPELTMGVFLSPMEIISGNQVANLRLMQMFPWFGVLKSAKDEMSLMANAKFEVFRDAKFQVCYDVQRTWYELFKIQKQIEISEKNIEILRTIERLTIIKFSSLQTNGPLPQPANASMPSGSNQNLAAGNQSMQGMGGGQNASSSSAIQSAPAMQPGSMPASGNQGLADVYRIRMETAELENAKELLRNRLTTVTSQFNSYLNRPSESRVYIPDIIIPDSLGISISDVSDSMLLKNPMLGMLDYERQSIEAKKRMIARMGYPMVGIGFDYSVISKNSMSVSQMNGKDMVMPMLTVSLPVYRKKYKAMENEAELLKEASIQNYKSTVNSLQSEYYKAVQLYLDAQRRVKLYDSQYQLSSGTLELMINSFSVSSAGLTDVLRTRQQTLDYEIRKVEAVADLNIAVAWLERLMSASKN